MRNLVELQFSLQSRSQGWRLNRTLAQQLDLFERKLVQRCFLEQANQLVVGQASSALKQTAERGERRGGVGGAGRTAAE